MTARATVWIAAASASAVEALRVMIESAGARVRVVSLDDRPAANGESPELLVIAAASGDDRAEPLSRAFQSEPLERRPMIVVAPENACGPAPAIDGADYHAWRPLEPREWRDWIELARRTRDERERAAESDRLREALTRSEQRLVEVLVAMVDLALPGAAARGARNATLARQIAMRFEVPPPLLRDLELAARLQELGRVVTPASPHVADPSGPESERWQYTQSSVAILKLIPGLEGTAELVANLYENWDGTGFPDRWLQGQIPLRCRILRALIDVFAALERRGGDFDDVLDWIEEHAGTRYDPMVVVHLKAVLAGNSRGEWVGSNLRLPITELRDGMVLAEDLYTDSGLKLLSQGTEITPATLQIILRRHKVEPILHGAAVLRKSA